MALSTVPFMIVQFKHDSFHIQAIKRYDRSVAVPAPEDQNRISTDSPGVKLDVTSRENSSLRYLFAGESQRRRQLRARSMASCGVRLTSGQSLAHW